MSSHTSEKIRPIECIDSRVRSLSLSFTSDDLEIVLLLRNFQDRRTDNNTFEVLAISEMKLWNPNVVTLSALQNLLTVSAYISLEKTGRRNDRPVLSIDKHVHYVGV